MKLIQNGLDSTFGRRRRNNQMHLAMLVQEREPKNV